MKKIWVRMGIAGGTLVLVVAGAAAFSAFEAHVVNVTATINNATDISTNSLLLGNVFPQEVLHNPVTLSLSSSFLSASNTNASEVDYVLKQKPTCGLPVPDTNPVQYQETEQALDGPNGSFVCPTSGRDGQLEGQYVLLPLLCPYLSKTGANAGDVSIPSFHGPTDLASWTDPVSTQLEASGKLLKTGPTSDTWDIDLHTPCFKGQCAQDWDSFVTTANPNVTPNPEYYQADPSLAGQEMGCDLWYEVSGINGGACVQPVSQSVVSDTSNTVEGAGNAAALSFIHPAWTASIPGATWIWSTDPVLAPTTVDDTETFNKTFNVPSAVATASLDIAADNFYTVYVNGVQVGSEQVDQNNFQLATQDHYVITNLVPGSNTIKVVARNLGVPDSTPATNPAGVLYNLSYTTTGTCNQ